MHLSIHNPKHPSKPFLRSDGRREEEFLTVEEGLGGDEEGGGAHPQQHDELQEPEAEGFHKAKQRVSFSPMLLTNKWSNIF